MIKMAAGGRTSVIVILSSLHKGPQEIFCGKNKCYEGDKGKYTIKFRPFFRGETRMLVNKELQDKKKDER